MPSAWNSALLEATEARICYHMSIGSSREFMWRKAKAAILAVAKDIRRLPSGRIVNMPRLREQTTQQELEAIIRGEKLAVPPKMEECLQVPPERDFNQHPYLRRMEYRGGGFAILMAFELRRRRTNLRQFMFKTEIIRDAQPFCDISMISTDGWMRSSACGWASHQSLLQHRLLIAGRNVAQGSSRNAHGEEFSLSDDGHKFLHVMLQKWPLPEDLAEPLSADCNNASSEGYQTRIPRRRKVWAARVLNMSTNALLEAPTPQRIQSGSFIAPSTVTRALAATSSNASSSDSLRMKRSRRFTHISSLSKGLAKKLRTSAASKPNSDHAFSAQRLEPDEIAIEVSSEDEVETDAEHESDTSSALSILIDDRERLRDAAPRHFLERVSVAVNSGAHVLRQRLKLGDFAWTFNSAGETSIGCVMSNLIIERKRISDLVGRSASGAHMQQIQRLEFCSLTRPYVLIEGELGQAESCRVYDEALPADSAEGVERRRIHSREDIDDLCAHLLVRQSKVGVVMTKDAESTVRVLAEFCEWLGWVAVAETDQKLVAFSECSLRDIEEQDTEYPRAQRELTSMLLRTGAPTSIVENVRANYPSLQCVCNAVRPCASPMHRLHFFDCLLGCADHRERICGALGIDVPVGSAASKISPRQVHIGATVAMRERILTPGMPSHIVVKDDPFSTPEASIGACAAEVGVSAGLLDDSSLTRFYSEKIFIVVISGKRLLEAVLEQIRKLGLSGHAAAVATETARAVSRELLEMPFGRSCAIRLIIVEGVRAAVLHEARSCHSPGPSNQHVILPRLLKLVELTAFILDLSFGWRVRVHESKPGATTSQFLKAVIVAAHAGMSLPYACERGIVVSTDSER